MNIEQKIKANTNGFLNAGVLINVVLTLIMGMISRYEMLLPYIAIFLGLTILGWLLIVLNYFVIGAVILCIGCIPFIPLGVFGIIGVMKQKNHRKVTNYIQNEYGSNNDIQS